MRNVYELVRVFYEEKITWEAVIKREWVEGYLRQKAWQGSTDDELRGLWLTIQTFEAYLANAETDYSEFLDAMPDWEYAEAIKWLNEHVEGFKKSLKALNSFFAVLIDFYKYLETRKLIQSTEELERAAKVIAGGKKVDLDSLQPPIDNGLGLFDRSLTDSDLLPEIAPAIGEAVERLMNKLGNFFQQKHFHEDFERALLLFTGPLHEIPKDENEDFWLGFWDYFLFDYRLIASDQTPLAHFYATHAKRLNSDESLILGDLLEARFCVFYVDKIVNRDLVECVNLLTEERFQLPYPEIDYKIFKSQLFVGHLFHQDRTLINYVTSIEMSPKLRRRLKEEVVRQKQIYTMQQPEADWSRFFARHALVVRHTIDLLSNLAKMHVTPRTQMERQFPVIVAHRQANQEVLELITSTMPNFGFSVHDIFLAHKLWDDYSQITTGIIRKPSAWAAAVIYVFSQINMPTGIPAEALADELDISTATIYTNRHKLFDQLQLEKFDPRYLNEEGFVYSLFSS